MQERLLILSRLRSRVVLRSPANWLLLVFAAALLVSLLISPFRGRSLRAAAPLALGLVGYAVLAVGRWPKRALMWVWTGCLLAGLTLALLAVLGMEPRPDDYVWPALRNWHMAWVQRTSALGLRLGDTFQHNVMASALTVLFPFCVAGVMNAGVRPRWLFRGIAWVAVLLMLVGILLTESRGGYMALAASLAVFAVLMMNRRWRRRGLVMGLVVAGVAGVLGWQTLMASYNGGGALFDAGFRAQVWSLALKTIQRFPVTGVGFGCFGPVSDLLIPGHPAFPPGWPHAHQLFLQVAIDMGLVGCAAFVGLLGTGFWMLWRSRRKLAGDAHDDMRLLAAACAASLAGLCAQGMVDAALWISRAAPLIWLVLGLAAALYHLGEGQPEV